MTASPRLPARKPPPRDRERLREEEEKEVEGYSMPLLAHLEELRTRLIRIAIAIVLGFCVAAPFGQELLMLLKQQALPYFPEGSNFIYTQLPDEFVTRLKASLYASLLLTAPYCFWQAWKFVGPGLYRSERQAVMPLVVTSYSLFLLGGSFAYFGVLRFTNQFFLAFADATTKAQISVADYLNYCMFTLLSMGLVFQIPLVMGFLARIGAVSPQQMRKARRYMVVVIWFTAAIITPPDVLSQALMAIPMMGLFEAGILWSVVQHRRYLGAGDSTEDGAGA